ncbi:MAG: TetR/AcrR family transcriptional regulator [Rubrivivax sp.]|jgi:TetR/AcrR family transcriptional repressor of nem operon
MPRERSFSEPEVVDRLADAFTTHGFGGTSMAVLQEATGLGKQSLYNAFGDKAALYRLAVEGAVARFSAGLSAAQAAPDGRAALALLFERLIEDCRSEQPSRQRCIVTCGLLEDLDDPALRSLLEHKWLATHEFIRSQVERGQRDGSIASPRPSAALADQLMLAVGGLRVMARVPGGAQRLAHSVAAQLTLLDGP